MSQSSNSEEASRQSFPTQIPPPLFAIGTKICWDSTSGDEPDCGLVIGMRYIWGEHLRQWQYQYYIALNTNSPSYQWAKFDWGWQEDLRLVHLADMRSEARKPSEERNNDE